MNRIRYRLFRFSKSALQSLGLFRVGQPAALAVLGCQRSGTTMLMNALERDWRTRVYYEWDSRLFSSLRLKDADVVAGRLRQDGRHLAVAKPLLDSQWADDFLRTNPQAHAIWIYRHYAAVARSNLRLFGRGNGRRNLAPILGTENGDWRAERTAPETRATIRSLADDNASDEDMAALFWFARNSHFFDHGLDRHPRVCLCNYEDVVRDPAGSLWAIYDAVGVARPGSRIASEIHHDAGGGPELRLSKGVEAACQDLWLRLEEAKRAQAQARVRADAPVAQPT